MKSNLSKRKPDWMITDHDYGGSAREKGEIIKLSKQVLVVYERDGEVVC